MDTDQYSKVEQELSVVHVSDKATVMSGYELTKKEVDTIKNSYPQLRDVKLLNVVDKNIISGVIIKIGTQLIDLTLNGALQNLRNNMYESN